MTTCRNRDIRNGATLVPRSCLRCKLGPCHFPDDLAPMRDKLDLSIGALREREQAWQDDQPVNVDAPSIVHDPVSGLSFSITEYVPELGNPPFSESLWDTSRLHGVIINEEGDGI